MTRHYPTRPDMSCAGDTCYPPDKEIAAPDPGSGRSYCHGGERRELLPLAVSRVSNPDSVTSTGLAAPPALVPVPRPQDHADPSLRPGSDATSAVPPAGLPGHGSGAVLRLQSACIVDGQIQGGYNDVYELVCPAAAMIRTCITPTSRRGFSGFAGRAR